MVGNQLKRVTEPRQTSDQTYKRGIGVPLCLTYHPRLKNANDIIKKHLVLWYVKEQVKNIFTPPLFVIFRVGFSLRKHLVRAKVYPLLRECGSSGCNKSRCQNCLNVNHTNVFQSYKINHKFDCDSKCIIYLFSCKACGLHYVGSTVERFRYIWNNYKNCQRVAAQGVAPSQSFFHQHFLSEGHHGLVNDCEITLIDKTDSSGPTRRESFRIRLFKTYYPLRLNIDEEFWVPIF